MILCHCHRVTDRQVYGCVRAGARSVRDVARACGAATGCGGCKRAIAEAVEVASRESGTGLLPVLSGR